MLTGIYAIKPWFRARLLPVVRWLGARGVHPDALTLAAIPTGALMGWALVAGGRHPLLLLAVLPLGVLRLMFNAMDGLLAQETGKARAFGEVLNEFCDRLTDLAIYAGLPLGAWVSWPVAAAWISLVLLVSFTGVLARAAGARRQYGGPFGKADRTLLLGLGAAVAAVWPGLPALAWFVWAGFLLCGVTLWRRIGQTHRELSGKGVA